LQFPNIGGHVAQILLEPRFQPTHHFRSFTLTVLLAVVTFLVALALVAHYAPVR
jgi:hypothetical protein